MLFILCTIATNDWTQLGNDIDGENTGDLSGYSVAMSSDGLIVAIGAYGNDGGGSESGHVRVFTHSGNQSDDWVKLGSDIDGEAAGDFSGISVAMSSDGLTVAIGATRNDGGGSESGHVRVFTHSGNQSDDWVKLGSDIDGENTGDLSGYSVAMSSDGLIVAIGATDNNGGGSKSGHVRVYTHSGNQSDDWVKLGSDIDGEDVDDESGSSIALSSNGLTVAIGSSGNDGQGTQSGHVRVYTHSGNHSDDWVKLGSDIDGENIEDVSGTSVALSSDGLTVAIGAPGNDGGGSQSGHVRVFTHSGNQSDDWVKLGHDIDGEQHNSLGKSVALSSDGLTVAIAKGATEIVQVYSYHEIENLECWSQIGNDITGENANDRFGVSIAMNSDATKIIIGASENNGINGIDSGHAQVYEAPITSSTESSTTTSSTTTSSDDTLSRGEIVLLCLGSAALVGLFAYASCQITRVSDNNEEKQVFL